MTSTALLSLLVSVLAAGGAAYVLDVSTARKGLLPIGFREPWRRGGAAIVMASTFWFAVFAPLAATVSGATEDIPPPTSISPPQLFVVHALLVVTMWAWYSMAFGGFFPLVTPRSERSEDGEERFSTPATERPPSHRVAAQFGLESRNPLEEVAIGVAAGVLAVAGVFMAAITIAGIAQLLGLEEALPTEPPVEVGLMAALPLGWRLALSASAGLVEETFFRGLLQPRMGVLASTFLFVIAHAGYQSPLMLVNLTLVSLLMSLLVVWRQNVVAAAVAHFIFDAVQLLIVIPVALRFVP